MPRHKIYLTVFLAQFVLRSQSVNYAGAIKFDVETEFESTIREVPSSLVYDGAFVYNKVENLTLGYSYGTDHSSRRKKREVLGNKILSGQFFQVESTDTTTEIVFSAIRAGDQISTLRRKRDISEQLLATVNTAQQVQSRSKRDRVKPEQMRVDTHVSVTIYNEKQTLTSEPYALITITMKIFAENDEPIFIFQFSFSVKLAEAELYKSRKKRSWALARERGCNNAWDWARERDGLPPDPICIRGRDDKTTLLGELLPRQCELVKTIRFDDLDNQASMERKLYGIGEILCQKYDFTYENGLPRVTYTDSSCMQTYHGWHGKIKPFFGNYYVTSITFTSFADRLVRIKYGRAAYGVDNDMTCPVEILHNNVAVSSVPSGVNAVAEVFIMVKAGDQIRIEDSVEKRITRGQFEPCFIALYLIQIMNCKTIHFAKYPRDGDTCTVNTDCVSNDCRGGQCCKKDIDDSCKVCGDTGGCVTSWVADSPWLRAWYKELLG